MVKNDRMQKNMYQNTIKSEYTNKKSRQFHDILDIDRQPDIDKNSKKFSLSHKMMWRCQQQFCLL